MQEKTHVDVEMHRKGYNKKIYPMKCEQSALQPNGTAYENLPKDKCYTVNFPPLIFLLSLCYEK